MGNGKKCFGSTGKEVATDTQERGHLCKIIIDK
jgi:hypothetical protein